LFTVSDSVCANAAIIVTLATPSTTGSVVFTQDISFTVTTAGQFDRIVLNEWVISDGNLNEAPGGFLPSLLNYNLNGGPVLTVGLNGIADNYAVTTNEVTHNEGYIQISPPISLAVNEVFTVKAATYVLGTGSIPAVFNSQGNQSFTGGAFLSTNLGVRLSDMTPLGAVPVPSRTILLAIGLASMMSRRRRLVYASFI
jgi:hypothetical protein